MKKIIIILILLLSSVSYAFENTYSDVTEGAWYYETVMTLTSNDIISGYTDGTFRPNDTISVEEFITLTVKTMGKEAADITNVRWSDGFIQTAKIEQWVQTNEFLDFTRDITRGEMSRIVLRASNLEVPEDFLSYGIMITDLLTMNQYWQNIVVRTYALGIISGYPDGSFKPDGKATRAEASAILSKILDPSKLQTPELIVTKFDLRRNQILLLWQQLSTPYTGAVYLTEDKVDSPYSSGVLTEGYLNEALNMLNFIREVAYLNGNTYTTENANNLAQHGSILNAVSEFSHTPAQPSDMSNTFYDLGYNATSTGNLAAGIDRLSTAIIRLVDDEDVDNIEVIGHRRWFLLPELFEVGMGYTEIATDYRYYSVVKVFDNLETKSFSFDKVLWPSSTAFPIEFFKMEIPWSITLNPSIYDKSKVGDINVVLENLTTGSVYNFDQTDKDKEGEYFNVETNGYGIPFCIIFRPDFKNVTDYAVGDLLSITVNNVYLTTGEKTSFNYQTKFFTLK